MLSSKYSNVLTMLLVVFIVAIIGVMGYFGYDLFNSKKVNSDAQSTLDEFQKAIKKEKVATNDDNDDEIANEIGNVTNPLELLQTRTTANQQQEETATEPEKVYMEGYEVKGRIQIPKTKVDYPVLESVTKKSLEVAVGIAYGPGLNEVGNTIIEMTYFSQKIKLYQMVIEY